MSDLPTGTVSFLFTDIEGSTELLSALGDGYPALLERHHELLRQAITAHRGHEVGTEGDAFFVAFTDATDAVQAAIDSQRALNAESWPVGAEIKVRMGIHTGTGSVGADGYVGLDVHRAARVAAAGHGGQILVSDATRALAEPALPQDVRFRDLGSHRLKGLPAPEHIYQLVVDGLPSDFPAIRSVEARPNNLPVALTSFVGRDSQISEIRDRLGATRLLTLTGPGGTGKTRLCIRVAEEVIADYEHGCWFVGLDALRDPALVPSTIADSLGVRVPPGRPVTDTLQSWLADRKLLLVIDNFEQVVGGGSYIPPLLRAAAGVRVLATSRIPLRIQGEQEYPVPPLTDESVRLFVERASAVRPDFALTESNRHAVEQLCARLDGLPLAIELAAARIKLLSPEEMLTRLESNINLLASTSQDLPERQRTLRGAIDWSCQLLTDPERRLFARLSIFRGGFTLAAAETVCADAELGVDVLDGVSALVDNSLVRVDPSSSETRFDMLETIHEYARERLAASPDFAPITARHVEHFLALAASAGSELTGPEGSRAVESLQQDRDNIRAAFERGPGAGLLHETLMAAGAMWRFWQTQGEFAEGRAILERLLAYPDADPMARAAALTAEGGLAYWQGDVPTMARDYRAAREVYELSGDEALVAEALYNESFVPIMTGHPEGGPPLLERARELYERIGDDDGAAAVLDFLGMNYVIQGHGELAVEILERALIAFRESGAQWRLADGTSAVAYAYAEVGDWPRAIEATRQSVEQFREIRGDVGLSIGLKSAASLAAWAGDAERAALIFGKIDEIGQRVGGGPPVQILPTDLYEDKARDELGEARFDELYAQGKLISTDDAVSLALGLEVPPNTPPLAAPNTRLRATSDRV